MTVPASSASYVDCAKLTSTKGSSSSMIATVVVLGVPSMTCAGIARKLSTTLSSSSSTVSSTALKVIVFDVWPAPK